MNKKRSLMVLSILVVGLFVLASCGPTPTPTPIPTPVPTPKPAAPTATPLVIEKVITATPAPTATADTSRYGGTLVIQTGALKQFDPIFCADDPSFHAISNIFSLLFRRQKLGDPFPDLATSWEYQNDTTLIFHLRKGVMWHDDNAVFPKGQSREVVADDVVYSIKRAVETEGNTTAADFKAAYQSVEALDKYTVKLTLKTADALMFSPGRGLSGMAIVPHEAVEKLGKDFALNPVGSGPFKFKEYKPDESLTLVRNDLYWKKPYLDKVVYKVIPDANVAVISLETGEVDTVATVPSSELERLNADNRFVLDNSGCPAMAQVTFNMKDPLYADPKFRQAVAYAIDGEAIGINVFGIRRMPGCGTAGPGVPGYDPDLCKKYFGYDPEKAKALFKELGWTPNKDGLLEKNGQLMKFPLEIWSTSPMPQIGEAVATQLKQIGIPVELQTVEFGTWIDDWNKGADKVMIMSGWCGDGGMNGLWGGSGLARAQGYDDSEVFALLDQANIIVDPAKRDEVLRQAANKIYGQYWAVPISFQVGYNATRSWVEEYQYPMWWENICTEKNNVWLTRKK
jgi:peptide/nickel transport system substrate-binding protein